MLAPVLSPTDPVPSGTPDPALQAALAELLQLGLVVARVAARLAEVEGRAVEALADAAVDVTRVVLATHGSQADAARAGHDADVSDAARDAIAARMSSITDVFDKAARAVRRTAALQARLLEARRWRDRPWDERRPASPARGTPGTAARAANDAERADRLDEPDWGDEILGQSDEDVLRDVRRDLGLAIQAESRIETPLAEPRADGSARGGATGGAPRIVRPVPEPNCPSGTRREPDT